MVCLAVNLTLSILAIRHTLKYYKQENWDFDNDDVGMLITYLIFGFYGLIDSLTYFPLKHEYNDWKITKWLNKKNKGETKDE